ncbi:MAG: 3-phosphoshikimate 1-carboxyvinyltransferase [Pseudomonadota bacterium]
MDLPNSDDGIAASGAWRALPGAALSGAATAPGDKSISHRALLFGAMANGETRITGLLEGDDVMRTAAAMRALGAAVDRDFDDNGAPEWRVSGAPWRAPAHPLYFGNSGTGCRLVMGAAAGRIADGAVGFDGDQSLRARPMGRIIDPLAGMGAVFESETGRLPVVLKAGGRLRGVDYTLPKPSAQVKSAVLLAGLGAGGVTRVHEPTLCRDHTERMLQAFGARLTIETDTGGAGRTIALAGGQTLKAADVAVPGDPSSAAFLVAAALVTPGSEILVKNVLLNPLRAGVFETFKEMGADLNYEHRREAGGEPVADIHVRYSRLHGVAVPASRAPAMIDEYPILAVTAAFAEGDTYMPGVEELRVKETDRIDATEALLRANGVETDSGPDWLRVVGCAPRGVAKEAASPVPGGGGVETRHDHRIAMAGLVLGLAAAAPVTIDEAAMVATSFPTFFDSMKRLGAQLEAI